MIGSEVDGEVLEVNGSGGYGECCGPNVVLGQLVRH